MHRFARVLLPALCGAWLAGCAGQRMVRPAPVHQGESSYRALSDRGMVRYQLALGSISSGAAPIDHPAPVYPASQLAACPSLVRLRALLIVDTRGKVGEVRINPAPGVAPAFAVAVRKAAMQWTFVPLSISHWAANANDDSHTVDTEFMPFSLPYEFSFACHDGKPRTGSSAD